MATDPRVQFTEPAARQADAMGDLGKRIEAVERRAARQPQIISYGAQSSAEITCNTDPPSWNAWNLGTIYVPSNTVAMCGFHGEFRRDAVAHNLELRFSDNVQFPAAGAPPQVVLNNLLTTNQTYYSAPGFVSGAASWGSAAGSPLWLPLSVGEHTLYLNMRNSAVAANTYHTGVQVWVFIP